MTNKMPHTEVIRHQLKMRMLEVVSIERPTPRLVRVGLAGQDLAGFRSDGPADHVKVFFPEEGERIAKVPELGPDGIKVKQSSPPVRGRDYTPKHRPDVDDELQLDIVLHEVGLGASWAERATLGDQLGVAGPRGSQVLKTEMEGYVLIGDETALPAIQNWLVHIPQTTPVQIFVEARYETERQPIDMTIHRSITWVDRGNGDAKDLLAALTGANLPVGQVYFWAAGEAGVVHRVRAYLQDDLKIDRDLIETRGYWRQGTADHQEPHKD